MLKAIVNTLVAALAIVLFFDRPPRFPDDKDY